jgi:hypothetical protein
MRKLTSKGGFGLAVALCLVGCQKEGLTFLDSGISPGTGGTSIPGSQGGAGGLATGGANGHGGSAGGFGGAPGTGGQLALGGSIGLGGNVGAGGSATGGRDASVDAGCPAGWTLCCGQCLSPQAGICSMPCSATGGAISTGGATSSGGVGAGSGGTKTGSGGATSSGGAGAGSGGSKTGSGGAKTGGAGGNSGGTGGTSHYDGGQPVDGGVSCTDFQNAYAAALPAARSCDVAAVGQCQQSVSSSLSPCFVNCMTYVNDASTLNKLKLEWQQQGCNSLVGILCPAIACIAPTAGVCTATDGGGGVCTDQTLVATPTL